VSENGDRRAKVGLNGVVEGLDERMIPQDLLDTHALDADPSSMNESDFPQTGLMRRAHVLVDDRRDVPRQERVQVERVFDWDATHV
jgi:hypothetical protein